MSSALLLILSAPSGAGKSTLARRLCAAHPEAIRSVSFTTRAPRGAERDGLDYHFVDDARFAELVKQGAFIESAEVHGRRYGTPRLAIDLARARGALAVFDIDVQGGEAIQARFPEAVRVLVLPPSMQELERRLRARGTDDEPTIRRRLEAARREVERSRSYEYWVKNDDLERAFGDLEAIVRAERGDPTARARAEGCRAGELDLAAMGF